MGRYLLNTFFGGDYDAFQSRGRKHVSFRKLEEREDLQAVIDAGRAKVTGDLAPF